MLSFNLGSDVLGFNLDSDGLKAGLEMVIGILNSTRYAEVVLGNIDDENKPSLDQVREMIGNFVISVSCIKIAAHLDAYALVYRRDDPSTIFFNPLLLMQFALKERESPGDQELVNMHATFIAIKTAHEFGHLIHPQISQNLKLSVMPKHLGGGGKRKMMTPERSKGGAVFSDYGEMIEYDLVGGVMELYAQNGSNQHAFSVTHLILYPHPRAREGRLVHALPQRPVMDDALDGLRLPTYLVPVNKPAKGPRGHLDITCGARFSLDIPESDVIEGDDEEENNDNTKEATF